ncbi:MAG TPA: hypothetical protein VG937_26925 [Polyangiaceae bacterium]|nr:hypothetical protein [Polyangiaceae bacterium]
MIGRPRLGRIALLGLTFLLLISSGSCYRAELDVSPWTRQSPEGGDSSLGAAGASGGSSGAACDDTSLDSVQQECRQGALPTRLDCSPPDEPGWSGCYDGGCAVCTKSVREYPYYFDWHPCCLANDTCGSSAPVKCNARCPQPTEHDKRKPCFVIEL